MGYEMMSCADGHDWAADRHFDPESNYELDDALDLFNRDDVRAGEAFRTGTRDVSALMTEPKMVLGAYRCAR